MFALAVAVAATVLLTPRSYAQDTAQYRVWSSVIFSRTGERTPTILTNSTPILTPLGAVQQQSSGSFFRQRYTSSGSSNGIDGAPIQGLSPNIINSDQIYIMALEQQYSVASAQAFLQGLFPPYSVGDNASEIERMLDPASILSNGSYVEGPMSGYQYAQIQTADAWDIQYPYIGGQIGCPALDIASAAYFETPAFLQTQAVSSGIYATIGEAFLQDLLPQEELWDYYNAYAIYDYISYQNTHNATVAAMLSDSQFANSATNVSYLEYLRWYADEQSYAWYANMTAHNNITSDGLPDGVKGSISTLPGNMLAAKLLSQFQVNIANAGEYYKLNLFFGDFEPLISLFALLDLPSLNTHFYGLPNFASAVVLELFTIGEAETASYPSEEDLWVRFSFRNGTEADESLLGYSLFNNGPSNLDIPWTQFRDQMYEILVADVGDWCTQCGSDLLFCLAFQTSDAVSAASAGSGNGHSVSPAVGGVIGAVVTLAIAGLLFALAMLVGGVRVHRVHKSHRGDLGGFKGGQKMRSDQDLTISKDGAVVGATVVSPESPTGGHERVGSWELRNNESGMPNIVSGTTEAGHVRSSFEDDDIGSNPFRDPVKADERV